MTELASTRVGGQDGRSVATAESLGAAGSVQSVSRALRLLEQLAAQRTGAGIADLARATSLPHGTVHRLLQTLAGHGWVRRGSDRRYVLGAALIRLGAAAEQLLAAGATPYLAELVRLSGETANLAVLDGDCVAYVAQVPSEHRLRMFAEVGNRVPLHSTGVGKVLLAGRPPEEADALLARTGLPPRTPDTITDPRRLRAELDRIRRQGFAVDSGEEEVGVRCLAVPVHGTDGANRAAQAGRALTAPHGGDVIAALSVSGPVARFGSVDVAALARRMQAVADLFGAAVLAGDGAGDGDGRRAEQTAPAQKTGRARE